MKENANRLSMRYNQELDLVNSEQKSDQDRIENETRILSDIQNKRRQRHHELGEMQTRFDRLTEHIKSSEIALEERRKLEGELSNEVHTSKNQIETLQKQLEEVSKNLGEAHIDKHDSARQRRKESIVENLKRLYGGVHDRVINLCSPVHPKYNLAVTKTFGNYMEAIVVDTEEVAKICIKYLKEQMLEPETFLPLNYLQVSTKRQRIVI